MSGPLAGCVTTTCPASTTVKTCPVTGLEPDTTYAVEVVPVKADGTEGPASNEDVITTPTAVVVTSAEPYGPTSALVTATSPAGNDYKEWQFIATPVGGGTPITVTSDSPEARFFNLQPNTQYEVTAVGVLPDGTQEESSNSLLMTTPPLG